MSFMEDGYRTGFPDICPENEPGRVTRAEACGDCSFCMVDERGHWRCDHHDYQKAPGIHWCEGCSIELGPYAEVQGWKTCGGPTGRCRYDDEREPARILADLPTLRHDEGVTTAIFIKRRERHAIGAAGEEGEG